MRNYISGLNHIPEIIYVSETCLKEGKGFKLHPYNIERLDRPGNRASGGVATFIRSDLSYARLDIKCSTIECIAIEIKNNNNNSIIIINVYDAPRNSFSLEEYKIIFNSFKGKVVITGDFNAHNPLWKSKQLDGRGKYIEDLVDEYNFTLLNTGEPTYHRTDGCVSVLDRTFVSRGLAHQSSWEVLPDTLGSDHMPTCTTIGEPVARESEDLPRWNLRKADWSKYRDTLINSINNLDLTDNIDSNAEIITQTILLAATKAIPLSKPKARRPIEVPYWNAECQQAISDRNSARNNPKNNRKADNSDNYKKLKGIAQGVVKSASQNYWQEYCNNLDKSTKMGSVWKMAKRMSGKAAGFRIPCLKIRGNNHFSNKEKANVLADSFAKVSSDANYSPEFIKIKNSYNNNNNNNNNKFTNIT